MGKERYQIGSICDTKTAVILLVIDYLDWGLRSSKEFPLECPTTAVTVS